MRVSLAPAIVVTCIILTWVRGLITSPSVLTQAHCSAVLGSSLYRLWVRVELSPEIDFSCICYMMYYFFSLSGLSGIVRFFKTNPHTPGNSINSSLVWIRGTAVPPISILSSLILAVSQCTMHFNIHTQSPARLEQAKLREAW